MTYEARLYARKWIDGNGWTTSPEEIESWSIEPDQLNWWKRAIEKKDLSIFDYVTDAEDYIPCDGDGSDIKWTMKLVAIDDDEKVIASTSIWESELFSEDNEDN